MAIRYMYDEAASAALHVDVVHEVPGCPPTSSEWLAAMRRLNAVTDDLSRRLVELHRECGTGTGVCDGLEEEPSQGGEQWSWGCETLAIIAAHHRITP